MNKGKKGNKESLECFNDLGKEPRNNKNTNNSNMPMTEPGIGQANNCAINSPPKKKASNIIIPLSMCRDFNQFK